MWSLFLGLPLGWVSDVRLERGLKEKGNTGWNLTWVTIRYTALYLLLQGTYMGKIYIL